MIEKHFDIPFVAALAMREKQIQQNYRPIIAVHKGFARRPGALFRGLILAEFGGRTVSESYYKAAGFTGKRVGDPFMGGGTPLLEANRTGCDVVGYDINPMAHWIVREEIEHIDLPAYRDAARTLRRRLEERVGALYRTRCEYCGSDAAHVKYFLWVKVQSCPACTTDVDLFPGYLLSEDARHPKNVFVCAGCGGLVETEDRKHPGNCNHCGAPVRVDGAAKRNRCSCTCGHEVRYPKPDDGPPRHRMFAIEYFCPLCKPRRQGRFFKKPDPSDLARTKDAEMMLAATKLEFAPIDEIPAGDETDRLHRWGYRRYREMFNARQLLGLELSAALIANQPNERIRHALATNLSDLLRYQNMLCRYDTMALKSLDIFSIHGFPVGLVQCESNLLGIPATADTNVGSGGWSNIVEKYAKAKAYCNEPFEIKYSGGRKVPIRISGEWIGETRNSLFEEPPRSVDLRCGNAAEAQLPAESLDAVLTDPPYFGNVQYAELMDFCYVWLKRFAPETAAHFRQASTRNSGELTGNANMERGLEHFTDGLSRVFQRMTAALRPGAPLAFTYHHNRLEAYAPIAVAILDAGLICTAAIPCPAEMGASIHINGTGSSIMDTILVSRKPPINEHPDPHNVPIRVALQSDREQLKRAGIETTPGDERCILFGHATRSATERLRVTWRADRPTSQKLSDAGIALAELVRDAESEQSNRKTVEFIADAQPSALPY
jgi:adenine-specific DNA methylase